MKHTEQFSDLMDCKTLQSWRDQVFSFGKNLGYEQTLLAILPDPNTPVESEFAFLHSNYSPDWRNKYDAEKMHHVDPTFSHCVSKSTPLIWSPDIFSDNRQKEMYEEASGYGIKSGVTLPIHGAKGELGILCFVSDIKPDVYFKREANHRLPELSYFRDFILESSQKFLSPSQPPAAISLTHRELECLKWAAAGKSSWEIGLIMKCAESTINFHFGNIRSKFGTTTRQQAIIKAINLGLIYPT